LVRRCVHPQIIEILRQFGLHENELITSQLVSRVVRRWQVKLGERIKRELPAESIERWFELNLPIEAKRPHQAE
jgi:hypothetical protein